MVARSSHIFQTLAIRGVARNEHLRGPGCNRNLLNIILKSIGYKMPEEATAVTAPLTGANAEA